MEEMYEFGYSSSDVYSVDDHLQPPYFGSPPAFCDGLAPMGFGSGNMSWACPETSAANLVVDKSGTSSSNLQLEDHPETDIRAKISSHPLYPKLLRTYIDCHKVKQFQFGNCLVERVDLEKERKKKSIFS